MTYERQIVYRNIFHLDHDESKMIITLISMIQDFIIKKEEDSEEKFKDILKLLRIPLKNYTVSIDYTLLVSPYLFDCLDPSDMYEGKHPSFIARFYIDAGKEKKSRDLFCIIGRTRLKDYKLISTSLIQRILEYLDARKDFENERITNPMSYKTRWKSYYDDIIVNCTGIENDILVSIFNNTSDYSILVKDASIHFYF